jgi:hypothetical protein
MKHLSIVLLLITTLFVVSVPVWAHHSFQAEYDHNKPLTLVGKLTRVQFENPHGWLYLDARNDAGKTVNWALETPGPRKLAENGFDRSIYQTLMMNGEVVTVTAFAARDGSKHAWAGGLIRADGTTVITLSGIPEQGPGARGGRDRQQ